MVRAAAHEGLRARTGALRGPGARRPLLLTRRGGGGAGQKSEVRDRLLRGSGGSAPPARPAPSSSEGSMESCCVQPGLVEPPLLWLRWWPRRPRSRNRPPRPRRLGRRGAEGEGPAGGPSAGAGGPSARRGLSLRVRLSSSVACRLPAELLGLASSEVSLPVACVKERALGEGRGGAGISPLRIQGSPAAPPRPHTGAPASAVAARSPLT